MSEFSVVAYFDDGTYRYVERWLDAKPAVMLAKVCTDSGEFARVIITDGGDNCVFDWNNKQGLIWPEDAVEQRLN